MAVRWRGAGMADAAASSFGEPPRDAELRVGLGSAARSRACALRRLASGHRRVGAEAECVLVDRKRYGIHLDGLNHRGEGLGSALSRVREVLAEDDRHMAKALVPERKGDEPRRREERIAALLDDPEKLRELHRRQIERREARRAAQRRRCKGRYQVRSMRM